MRNEGKRRFADLAVVEPVHPLRDWPAGRTGTVVDHLGASAIVEIVCDDGTIAVLSVHEKTLRLHEPESGLSRPAHTGGTTTGP